MESPLSANHCFASPFPYWWIFPAGLSVESHSLKWVLASVLTICSLLCDLGFNCLLPSLCVQTHTGHSFVLFSFQVCRTLMPLPFIYVCSCVLYTIVTLFFFFATNRAYMSLQCLNIVCFWSLCRNCLAITVFVIWKQTCRQGLCEPFTHTHYSIFGHRWHWTNTAKMCMAVDFTPVVPSITPKLMRISSASLSCIKSMMLTSSAQQQSAMQDTCISKLFLKRLQQTEEASHSMTVVWAGKHTQAMARNESTSSANQRQSSSALANQRQSSSALANQRQSSSASNTTHIRAVTENPPST